MFCVGGQPSLAYFTWIFRQVWCQCWLCRVFEVVTCLKVGCCRFFFHYRTPTLQVGCHLTTTCRPPLFSKLPPPNLSTSGTKNKVCHSSVDSTHYGRIVGVVWLLQSERPKCHKATAKAPCMTHPPNERDCVADWEPKTCIQLRKLFELASSTLITRFMSYNQEAGGLREVSK